ncbi:MAG TPA: ATP-binding protein [Flavisolibacter sp.]|nr:ATP-binding protein [Flavisolibacter sp.]
MKQTLKTESLSLLERALFILQDGIGIVEKDFTISYINSAAQDILEKQFRHRPSVGDCYLDYVASERQDIHREFISKAFENEPSALEVEFPGPCWYEVGYYPMPDEQGFITHVCIKAKEITQRIVLERKLKQERRDRKNNIIKATIEAQEKERSLIGRELHDNVNQVLTTVKLYTELSYQDEVPNKELLKRSVQQINYCIEEIRSLSRRLAVPKLGELGLEELIRDLVDTVNFTKKTSIKFLSYGIKNREFNQELQTTIYRIIQEQITNVIKYACATSVKVVIAGTNDDIAVQVQDNGIGFDLKEKSKGNGITNMISRAETLGGSLKFETAPGEGCTMTVEFPLNTL